MVPRSIGVPLVGVLASRSNVTAGRSRPGGSVASGLTYMRAQIVDHQKTSQLLQWEIGSGEDAEMQRFAADTLPTVLEHLAQA